MQLKMAGPNDPQDKWYRKDGGKKDYEGVCVVWPTGGGQRVAMEDNQRDQDRYLESVVGDAPLYVLGWEEHKIFVPDQNGGHMAYSANGILYRMDFSGDGKMVPRGPVHDTNRTIFTSSLSLF